MINSDGGREISKSSRASPIRFSPSANALNAATAISWRSSFINATAWRAAISSSALSPSDPTAAGPSSLISNRATCVAGRPSASIKETTHSASPSPSDCFNADEISVADSIVLASIPDFDEDFHVAAADHSLFVRGDVRIVAQAEFAQPRLVFGQRFARLGPDVGFDATAADGAHHRAVFKNQQFGASALGRRTGSRHNRRNREFLLIALRPADLFVNLALRQ